MNVANMTEAVLHQGWDAGMFDMPCFDMKFEIQNTKFETKY
jgi:hypothetical protein